MARRLVVCAYDVTEGRRLAAALSRATGWSHGGQRSAFECFASAREAPGLAGEVGDVLAPCEDRLAVFVPEPRRSFALGPGSIARDTPLVYIG